MQFEYYREHFLFGECNSLARCFETVADFGLRSSGGIGDMMGFDGYANKAMGPRFILDLMFFVLVLIILMNVIFGAFRRQQLARLASPRRGGFPSVRHRPLRCFGALPPPARARSHCPPAPLYLRASQVSLLTRSRSFAS